MFRVNSAGEITKNGSPLPVRCGNWFGLEGQHEPKDADNNADGAPLELYVGNMWWANGGEGSGRTVQQTFDEIKDLGINVVRLPIAPQTLEAGNEQGMGAAQDGGALKNHESVRAELGQDSGDALDALKNFIQLADQNDIDLIIDIHSCSNYLGWRAGRLDANPPYADQDREGYEFTRSQWSCGGGATNDQPYNEAAWLDNLRQIAGFNAELGVDNILGIDIFNEPWDYTWDEWATLSERAFEAIDSVNSDVLILVEGIGSLTSEGVEIPHGDSATNPNWGENFWGYAGDGTNGRPLDIPHERLVISPHTYGPSVFVQNHFLTGCEGLEGDEAGNADCQIEFSASTVELMRAGWDEHFGYLRDGEYNHPMIVGEFGGNMDWPNNTRAAEQEMWSHISPGIDEEWQNHFVDYMIEKNIFACYWSINPESGDTGGIYTTPYAPDTNEEAWGEWGEMDTRKTSLLKRLWGI